MPALTRLAARGEVGRAAVIPAGLPPGSDVGNMAILGVTVLTSATQETLKEIGIADEIENQVLRLATLGIATGVDGLVASPHETKTLRAACGNKIKIITPGVRPKGSDAADQKRVMTPRGALDAGADYLVIGRPITVNPRPREALAEILAELAADELR